ncbi:MAG: type VI secretion system baseplate subunit TssE [Pseudomonadota bacterium]
MFDRSLFERLAEPGKPAGQDVRIDPARLLDSILANLQHVFNARDGGTAIRTDLGMPDLTDVSVNFPNSVPHVLNAIRYQIQTFEPRLKDVVVKHVYEPDNPLGLRFQVAAEIDLPDGDDRILFETILGTDGFYRVRG